MSLWPQHCDEAVVPGRDEVDERPAGLVVVEAVGQVAAILAVAVQAVGQLVEEASSLAATEQVVVLAEVSVAAGLAVVDLVVGLAGADPEAVEVSTAEVVVAAEVSVEAAEVFLKVQPSPIHFQPTPLGSVVAQCLVSLESLSTKWVAQVSPTLGFLQRPARPSRQHDLHGGPRNRH